MIEDLESLTNCLINPNKKWKKDFSNLIWDLEVIYACASDENRNYFTQQETSRIKEILINLQDLIKEYKEKYLIDLDKEEN